MGHHQVDLINPENQARFLRNLLKDIQALELMLERHAFDSTRHIGAEQEFCLVTDNWRPARTALEILDAINDPRFTTELARFNLEANLTPEKISPNCLSNLEAQLRLLLRKAESAGKALSTKILLTGILPTISKHELEFHYMTPLPRYQALNTRTRQMRGSDFDLRITGVDELQITHDSVLFEACNTSIQLHLQIPQDDFIPSYNWSQAIAGPVLGVCANSPLLLGRELWCETRIALFQQSIDTRTSSYALRDQMPRVTFGDAWASGSVAEIFKNDVARYPALVYTEVETDSVSELEQGMIPALKSLSLHNSTVYRWNRPCYGITNGKPHLRIENRYLPAGPSLIDEMANFALWLGLMLGRPKEFDDIENAMDFKDARNNFIKTARHGKEAVMMWHEQLISERDLVTKELLPIAYKGLQESGIDKDEAQKLLDIIDQRAKSHIGAQWQVNAFRKLRKSMKTDDALLALTKTIYENQQINIPVHQWDLPQKSTETHESAKLVSHIMSTQLFTIEENDLAQLATSVMEWKNIHHMPVVNAVGELKGLLTWTHINRYRERVGNHEESMVADIMTRNVISIHPDTEISDAIKIMKRNEFGCLPVVYDRHLVGIITIKDVIHFDHIESNQ